jgi:hypothetical protein
VEAGDDPRVQLASMMRHTLQGFCTLELEPSGLALHGCTVHRMPDGREWIGLPAKPQLDRDGQHRKVPATGKPLYVPVVEIEAKEARERFQTAALAAMHQLLGAAS